MLKAVRRGSRFGDWRLTQKLGGGGNGEVWEAVRRTGEIFAIKVLNTRQNEQGYRLARFADEIQFLRDNQSRKGVLPLIDSELSASADTVSWYVMPKAVLLKEALGNDPKPALIIAAMASIAETLADLAKDGIGHRDIKPDNLFRLNEDWVIGDFGLVTYPSKDPRTQHGRKLGPAEYMAPEMRRSPDTALAEPADVYSLAKTLWVLLTGHDIPLPGPHRADDPMCAIANALKFTWSPELDRLIEECTYHDPQRRRPMTEVASELRRMCSEPPERQETADTIELEMRIADLTEASRRIREQQQEYQHLIALAAGELNDTLINPYGNEIGRKLPGFTMLSDRQQPLATALLPNQMFFRVVNYNWSLISPDAAKGAPSILIAGSLCVLDESGHCIISLLLQINSPNRGRASALNVYERVVESKIGSADLKQLIAELRNEIYSATPDLLRRYLSLLDTQDDNLAK